MAQEDELDALSHQLQECLGRIEQQACRMAAMVDTPCGLEEFDEGLDAETGELQQVMAMLLSSMERSRPAGSDVRRSAARAVEAVLRQMPYPVVVRTRMPGDLPTVAWEPDVLAAALERALVLAAGCAGAGGELEVQARADDEDIVVEIVARGTDPDDGGAQPADAGAGVDRSSSLCDFVAGMGGGCELGHDDSGALRLELRLRSALEREGG